MADTRYRLADNSPKAAAERNVPRNPRPLCREFEAQEPPSEFWCATCRWNRPMHDDEQHRDAIAAELLRLNTDSNDELDDDSLPADADYAWRDGRAVLVETVTVAGGLL